MLEFIQTFWLPISIFAVVVILAILLARARRRRTAGADPEIRGDEPAIPQEEGSETLAEDSATGLRKSFATAMRQLRARAGRRARYETPWFLLLGADGSRPRDFLSDLGMSLPFGPPPEMLPASGTGCNWWFFDGAIVLETGGAYMLREGGAGTDERGWRTLLRLLQKHRPERPVDGVILTVSCLELLEARRQGRAGMAEIERRTSLLYRKLSDAQRTLGIRFPLYLVVTGCERLPGFDSFCTAVPQALQDDIFGWSSPYNIETSFHEGWVDEAFASIGQRLDELRLEVFAEGSEIADPDELYLFPGTIQALKEPLRAVLKEVASASTYLGSMMLRGFYFCGAAQSAVRPPEPAAPPLDLGDSAIYASGSNAVFWDEEQFRDARAYRRRWSTGGTRFLRQLLEKKVFPEAALGRPTAGVLVVRNRAVRIAQIVLLLTALILGYGLWNRHSHLSPRKNELVGFLQDTAEELEKRKRREVGRTQADPEELRKSAAALVDRMANIDPEWFGSFLIPSSWLSRFNEDLELCFSRAFGQIIFEALWNLLDQKASELTAEPVRSRADPFAYLPRDRARTSETLAIRDMGEFQKLENLTGDLAELERIALIYRELRDTRDPQQLTEVIDYLFGVTRLPEHFDRQAVLFRSALKGANYRPFNLKNYQKPAQERIDALANAFLERLFTTFKDDLTTVSAGLRDLTQTFQVRHSATKVQEIQDLSDSIGRLQQALARPETEWAFRTDFNLGVEFEDLLAQMARLELLGADEETGMQRSLADELRDEAASRWDRYQVDLVSYHSDLTGRLLSLPQDGVHLELSLEVWRLDTALRALLAFTRVNRPQELNHEIAFDKQRLTWETGVLQQAVDLVRPYEQFREKQVQVFEDSQQVILEHLARVTMTAKLIELLNEAQRIDPATVNSAFREDLIFEEIRMFRAASEPLAEILHQLDMLGAGPTAAELSQLLAQQSHRLLADVNTLLDDEVLYVPRAGNLSLWKGVRPVSHVAYGVRDTAELQLYLDRQQQRLDQLVSNYAKPLVKWMDLQQTSLSLEQRRLFERWSGIVDGLEGYEKQKLDNRLAELEREILEVLPERSLEECARNPPVLGEQNDFFSEKRRHIDQQVYDRCLELAHGRARMGYQEVADYFTRRLAGQFPFAAAGLGVYETEADPDDLRGFYQVFDRHRSFLVDDQRNRVGDLIVEGNAEDKRQIEHFLEQIVRVRGFLAHFLDGEEAPAFDVEMEFRINRDNENVGNLIIDWEFEVADKQIRFRDRGEDRLRWSPGQAVRLHLRWAKDAPWEPVSNGGRPEVRVDRERRATLTYEFANRWALVSFLEDHRTPKRYLEGLAETRPHTLMFEIDTRTRASAGQAASVPALDEAARVFVRLMVRAPDSKDPLRLPDFPHRAPRLSAGTRTSGLRWPGSHRRGPTGRSSSSTATTGRQP